MKNIFILTILGLSIFSCKPKQTASSTTSNTTKTVEKAVPKDIELTVDEPRDSTTLLDVNISEMHNMTETGDSYSILSAKIIGNQLWLSLSYGGGCKEHQFEMFFNNAYLEEVNESAKVTSAINLTLKHNGNNDMCRSIVRQNVRFNLEEIQERGSNEIEIKLSGWEEGIIYTY